MVEALAILRIILDSERKSTKTTRIFILKRTLHLPYLMRIFQGNILIIQESVHLIMRDPSEPEVSRT